MAKLFAKVETQTRCQGERVANHFAARSSRNFVPPRLGLISGFPPRRQVE